MMKAALQLTQKITIIISILTLGLACSPKFYLVDRQTVLEDEAAGEWPEFEEDLLTRSKAQGPLPFSQSQASSKKDRLFQVLNGELMTGSND